MSQLAWEPQPNAEAPASTATSCADSLQSTAGTSRNIGCHPPNPDYQINGKLPQKFTGEERDAETRLDYFGARYMSAAEGRFIGPDPIGGQRSDPQSLNLYTYVLNNPLKFVDPTGMIVQWNDSDCEIEGDEVECRTQSQRAFESALQRRLNSRDASVSAGARLLQDKYRRLQASGAVFEVLNQGADAGANRGDIEYSGNDRFEINLFGNDPYGLSDNQRLAHEFEHGRQVLDGELSFYNLGGNWIPFAHDLNDEGLAFGAGFELEPASPGQGRVIN
jgi:RHS repeat-associated protein